MNILTVSHDFSVFGFRPDSTLIRSQDRFYLPGFVRSISFSPILYFRCSRPGRAVEVRFAHRYIDSFGYGILLYPEVSEAIKENKAFAESALDFTSVIPNAIHPLSDYGAFPTFKPLCVTVNGHQVSESPDHPTYEDLRRMISGITRFTSIRTGDFITYALTEGIPVEKDSRICLRSGPELLTSFLVL